MLTVLRVAFYKSPDPLFDELQIQCIVLAAKVLKG